MKGVKKCYGLLLASLITLGLSLSVSSGASALKHTYSSLYIPGFRVFNTPNIQSIDLNGGYWTEFPQSNSLSQPIPKSQRLLSSSTPCYNSSQSIPSLSSTSNTYIWSSSDFYFNVGLDSPYSLPSGSYDCHALNATSWYEYSSIPIKKSSSSHSTPASISDLFGSYSGNSGSSVKYMYSFNLPLTFNSSVVGAMTQGRTYEFHGSFYSGHKFYSSDASGHLSDFDLNHPYVLLRFSGVDSEFNRYQGVYSWADASSNRISNYCSSLYSSSDSTRLYFDCYFTAPADIVYSTFSITFQNYSQYDNNYAQLRLKPLWFNDGDYVFFGDFYVITDGDSSEGDDASIKNSGSDVFSAPGAQATMGDDYSYALTNMFDFSFINPFAPLFNMFTNASSCASIPIIAGMLGSSETTYCPWWPASVRNVLTPVFGLASTMLVFGFLVRWLSSSSGNMFEDQTTHKWGNTQIKQGGK